MLARSNWEVRPADPGRAAALAASCGVDPFIGQLLLNRGISEPTEARRFLTPELNRLGDPLTLPDMTRAVWRIRRAIAGKEQILVFGDSDVDGITASALLYEVLSWLGARVEVRLSNRIADGYGFPMDLSKRLSRLGIRLVILVDCGTNDAQAIRTLARQGIETIVLDHHVPMKQPARPLALVNPYCGDGSGRELCSAGLALKLAQALCPGDTARVDRCLDLAALGTLADYAPLIGENRILVSAGLARILDTPRPGLRRLCEAVQATKPTPEQILQRLVPRLNAAGRLGDAHPVWKLLVEPSLQTAHRWTELAGTAHTTTKALSREMFAQAHEQADRVHFRDELVMVLGRRGWHPGLMGPMASQLVERYARPAIAIALDERTGVGSGRSPAAFNLFEALRTCEGMLLRYGGHPQACGLTLRAGDLERFRERINRHAEITMGRRGLVRTLSIDAELTLRDVTPRLASAIERLRPFGPGNPKPLIVLRSLGIDIPHSGQAWLTDGTRRVRIRGRVEGFVPTERYDVVARLVLTGKEVALSLCEARLSTAHRGRLAPHAT